MKCNTAGMKEENRPMKTVCSIYLSAEVLGKLKQVALAQKRSLNFIIVEILSEWVSKQDGGNQ